MRAASASRTRELPLQSGNDAAIEPLARTDVALNILLHPRFPYRAADVVHACRHTMSRNVEDILSRRTRKLILDARAAIETAPTVAKLLATELKRDRDWASAQVKSFQTLATSYLRR